MNILFFSYLSYDNLTYSGGGWVKSIATSISKTGRHKVGIAYKTATLKSYKREIDGICYYPIYQRYSTIDKILELLLHRPKFVDNYDAVNSILSDFKPDIVQLFGMETSIGGILKNVMDIPVVVHIQGISPVYLINWFPRQISKSAVWWYAPIRNKFTCTTSTDFYHTFKETAEHETELWSKYKFYLGRTEWDYQVSKVLSPNSKYYVCNEVLRPEFYGRQWHFKKFNKVVISTTINGEIYKGFDTMLRTACLLKKLNVDFVWNIYGVGEDLAIRKVIEKTVGLKFNDFCIRFCGKKNAQELVDLLLDTTFYVHPSHIDNSPNSLCEAMLLGVPCIATYVGGVPSMLDNGVSGYLVPDGEAYQLAYLISTLKDDELTLNIISTNARTKALARHDEKVIVGALERTYNSIIEDFRNQ